MKNSIKKLCYSVFSLMLSALLLATLSCRHDSGGVNNPENPESPKQSETVLLKSLKVNGVEVEVKDEIDLKKTSLDRIKIDYKASP